MVEEVLVIRRYTGASLHCTLVVLRGHASATRSLEKVVPTLEVVLRCKLRLHHDHDVKVTSFGCGGGCSSVMPVATLRAAQARRCL